MEPDPSTDWIPVEIKPRFPNKKVALVYHQHGEEFACLACEIIALRDELIMAKTREEKIKETLLWYVEKAEAFKRYSNQKKTNAIEAVFVEMHLDAGKRGREALSLK